VPKLTAQGAQGSPAHGAAASEPAAP